MPLAALTAMADPERILYGTDIPFIGREQLGEQLVDMSAFPQWSDAQLAAVQRDNAARLFPRFNKA